MLKEGRCTWRHNCVLNHIFTLAQNLDEETDWIIHSDMSSHKNKCGISTIHRHSSYNQISDIIMINHPQKTTILIELMVCFETN